MRTRAPSRRHAPHARRLSGVTEAEDLGAALDSSSPEELERLATSTSVRVRVLVAGNGATPVAVVSRLATDLEERVRRAVTRRADLPPETGRDLRLDPVRSVRRLAQRRHPLAVGELVECLRQGLVDGFRSSQLIDYLDDEAVCEEVTSSLSHPMGAWFLARHGRMSPRAAVQVVRSYPHLIRVLADNERLSPVTLGALLRASHVDGSASDVVASRLAAEAAPWHRRLREPGIVRAHRIRRTGRDSLPWPLRLMKVNAHVARARAQCVPLGPVGQLLMLARRWDVRAALAANPALRPRIAVLLSRDQQWSVRHALAVSGAISAWSHRSLDSEHPAVRLALAAQPALPAHLVARLANDPSPFVRAVALRHPALNPVVLRGRAADARAPAWLLRSIAINPSCPDDLREELLVLLSVGGAGEWDPTFDPLTEAGNPGSVADSPFANITELARAGGVRSPLWSVRARWSAECRTMQIPQLRELARDCAPGVRLTAARFTSAPVLQELRNDAVPSVASWAGRTLAGMPRSTRTRRARALANPWIQSLLVVIGIAGAFNVLSHRSRYSPPRPVTYSERVVLARDEVRGCPPLGMTIAVLRDPESGQLAVQLAAEQRDTFVESADLVNVDRVPVPSTAAPLTLAVRPMDGRPIRLRLWLGESTRTVDIDLREIALGRTEVVCE